jgi:hypothetical protein
MVVKESDGTPQLNSDEIKQIEESVMDEIDQIHPSDQETVRPGYLGTKHWSGCLQIQCNQIKTFKIGDSKQVVKTKEDLNKTVKASFFILRKSVDEKAVPNGSRR